MINYGAVHYSPKFDKPRIALANVLSIHKSLG